MYQRKIKTIAELTERARAKLIARDAPPYFWDLGNMRGVFGTWVLKGTPSILWYELANYKHRGNKYQVTIFRDIPRSNENGWHPERLDHPVQKDFLFPESCHEFIENIFLQML